MRDVVSFSCVFERSDLISASRQSQVPAQGSPCNGSKQPGSAYLSLHARTSERERRSILRPLHGVCQITIAEPLRGCSSESRRAGRHVRAPPGRPGPGAPTLSVPPTAKRLRCTNEHPRYVMAQICQASFLPWAKRARNMSVSSSFLCKTLSCTKRRNSTPCARQRTRYWPPASIHDHETPRIPIL